VSGLLAELGRGALDLVVPQECAGCGTAGSSWCPRCQAQCTAASLAVPAVVPCRAACLHAGPAARAVVSFKESGARSLARPLGVLLARAVLDVLAEGRGGAADPVWLVPVPSRPQARRRRGADHVREIAGPAARELRRAGRPASRLPVLRHRAPSADQLGLTAAQRRANVAGTLVAGAVPRGTLVLVDDVTTTGATLAEAVRALRAAGGGPVLAATVTWAPPPGRALRPLAKPGPPG